MGDALHHLHKRKRMSQKQEPYPSKNRAKNIMDKLIFVIGVLGPIANLPQLSKIWSEHNAQGLSLISWASFLIFSWFWLAYGILHKDRLLILTYSLNIVINTIIVSGIMLYS